MKRYTGRVPSHQHMFVSFYWHISTATKHAVLSCYPVIKLPQQQTDRGVCDCKNTHSWTCKWDKQCNSLLPGSCGETSSTTRL